MTTASGLWCVACKQPIMAGEKVMRVGSRAGEYVHQKCPQSNAANMNKEFHMATPVKPTPKPAAKPVPKPAAKPAPAPAPKAAAPAPTPAPKPSPAPKAAAPAPKPAPVKAAAPTPKPAVAPAP